MGDGPPPASKQWMPGGSDSQGQFPMVGSVPAASSISDDINSVFVNASGADKIPAMHSQSTFAKPSPACNPNFNVAFSEQTTNRWGASLNDKMMQRMSIPSANAADTCSSPSIESSSAGYNPNQPKIFGSRLHSQISNFTKSPTVEKQKSQPIRERSESEAASSAWQDCNTLEGNGGMEIQATAEKPTADLKNETVLKEIDKGMVIDPVLDSKLYASALPRRSARSRKPKKGAPPEPESTETVNNDGDDKTPNDDTVKRKKNQDTKGKPNAKGKKKKKSSASTPHHFVYRKGKYVGLKNQGATCYINCLVQSLFHLQRMREVVEHLHMKEKDAATSVGLKKVFHGLLLSSKSVSTRVLTRALGLQNNDVNEQQDVHEYLSMVLSRLEQEVKGMEAEKVMKHLFFGKLEKRIRCLNIDHKFSKEEECTQLSLLVKGCGGLMDSLRQYCHEEILAGDNQYRVEGHGRQDVEKRYSFLRIPPVLTLCLRRFEYNREINAVAKIHQRFEFPTCVDLNEFVDNSESKDGHFSSFPTLSISALNQKGKEVEHPPETREEKNQVSLPSSLYILHSIFVHAGSASKGHYYVYIRPKPTLVPETDAKHIKETGCKWKDGGQWYCFDDEVVREVSHREAVENSYGPKKKMDQKTNGPGKSNSIQEEGKPKKKQRRSKCAYMLVYVQASEALYKADLKKDTLAKIEKAKKKWEQAKSDEKASKIQKKANKKMEPKDSEDESEDTPAVYIPSEFDLFLHEKITKVVSEKPTKRLSTLKSRLKDEWNKLSADDKKIYIDKVLKVKAMSNEEQQNWVANFLQSYQNEWKSVQVSRTKSWQHQISFGNFSTDTNKIRLNDIGFGMGIPYSYTGFTGSEERRKHRKYKSKKRSKNGFIWPPEYTIAKIKFILRLRQEIVDIQESSSYVYPLRGQYSQRIPWLQKKLAQLKGMSVDKLRKMEEYTFNIENYPQNERHPPTKEAEVELAESCIKKKEKKRKKKKEVEDVECRKPSPDTANLNYQPQENSETSKNRKKESKNFDSENGKNVSVSNEETGNNLSGPDKQESFQGSDETGIELANAEVAPSVEVNSEADRKLYREGMLERELATKLTLKSVSKDLTSKELIEKEKQEELKVKDREKMEPGESKDAVDEEVGDEQNARQLIDELQKEEPSDDGLSEDGLLEREVKVDDRKENEIMKEESAALQEKDGQKELRQIEIIACSQSPIAKDEGVVDEEEEVIRDFDEDIEVRTYSTANNFVKAHTEPVNVDNDHSISTISKAKKDSANMKTELADSIDDDYKTSTISKTAEDSVKVQTELADSIDGDRKTTTASNNVNDSVEAQADILNSIYDHHNNSVPSKIGKDSVETQTEMVDHSAPTLADLEGKSQKLASNGSDMNPMEIIENAMNTINTVVKEDDDSLMNETPPESIQGDEVGTKHSSEPPVLRPRARKRKAKSYSLINGKRKKTANKLSSAQRRELQELREKYQHPKGNRSDFILWRKQSRREDWKLKAPEGMKMGEFIKREWAGMPVKERQMWKVRAIKDTERYRREMEAWKTDTNRMKEYTMKAKAILKRIREERKISKRNYSKIDVQSNALKIDFQSDEEEEKYIEEIQVFEAELDRRARILSRQEVYLGSEEERMKMALKASMASAESDRYRRDRKERIRKSRESLPTKRTIRRAGKKKRKSKQVVEVEEDSENARIKSEEDRKSIDESRDSACPTGESKEEVKEIKASKITSKRRREVGVSLRPRKRNTNTKCEPKNAHEQHANRKRKGSQCRTKTSNTVKRQTRSSTKSLQVNASSLPRPNVNGSKDNKEVEGKKYICICGREFSHPSAMGGHSRGCEKRGEKENGKTVKKRNPKSKNASKSSKKKSTSSENSKEETASLKNVPKSSKKKTIASRPKATKVRGGSIRRRRR
mmetsp:Transcript_10981/g.16406  ORF Transcript_10981/g.16406 Transcript_10981/m.16406 type:complete len:1907 (+) Transcript_10981:7-5727(+)